jgi:hypothetical protein
MKAAAAANVPQSMPARIVARYTATGEAFAPSITSSVLPLMQRTPSTLVDAREWPHVWGAVDARPWRALYVCGWVEVGMRKALWGIGLALALSGAATAQTTRCANTIYGMPEFGMTCETSGGSSPPVS